MVPLARARREGSGVATSSRSSDTKATADCFGTAWVEGASASDLGEPPFRKACSSGVNSAVINAALSDRLADECIFQNLHKQLLNLNCSIGSARPHAPHHRPLPDRVGIHLP